MRAAAEATMGRKFPVLLTITMVGLVLLAMGPATNRNGGLYAKEKVPPIDPNDPTNRLFQFLDTSHEGKLTEFYLLADVYKNPKNPEEELQHVLRAEYDKNRSFGKLILSVRTVNKLGPEQLAIYTPKQIYEFGESDVEKFMKTELGAFGRPGDSYLRAEEPRPLASQPVTDEVRKTYEFLLTQHLLPALQKK
jgi:hypothetical protein